MSGDGYWNETIEVQCPWCCERVEISIEPDNLGTMVQDCEVCCNPWQLTIRRDRDGDADVQVERLDQ